MSDQNGNMKTIELHENGLDIQFRIRENGVVELADLSSQEVKKSNAFFSVITGLLGSKKGSHGAEGRYLLSGC